MSDLETVVREIAANYYFSLPYSTRSGAAVFVNEMLQLLQMPGLGAPAREAAAACEADYPVLNPTPLQESLRAALPDAGPRWPQSHRSRFQAWWPRPAALLNARGPKLRQLRLA